MVLAAHNTYMYTAQMIWFQECVFFNLSPLMPLIAVKYARATQNMTVVSLIRSAVYYAYMYAIKICRRGWSEICRQKIRAQQWGAWTRLWARRREWERLTGNWVNTTSIRMWLQFKCILRSINRMQFVHDDKKLHRTMCGVFCFLSRLQFPFPPNRLIH